MPIVPKKTLKSFLYVLKFILNEWIVGCLYLEAPVFALLHGPLLVPFRVA